MPESQSPPKQSPAPSASRSQSDSPTKAGPIGTAGFRGRVDHEEKAATSLTGRLTETRYYFRYLQPMSGLLALIILASLLSNILRLPVTFVPQQLTQHFGDKPYLWTFLGLTMTATLVAGLLSLWQGNSENRMAEHVARSLRIDIFARLECLSMLSVMSRGAGQFVQRITRDVDQIRDLFRMTLTSLLTQLIQVSVLLVVMLWIEPLLTVILVGLFAVIGPFVRRINGVVERLARKIQMLGEENIDQLVESVGGFREIQASARFDRFQRRFEQVTRETEATGVQAGQWAHIAGSLPTIAMSILVLVPYFLAVGRLNDVAELGRVITYASMLGQVLPVLTMMTRSSSLLARAAPALREVRRLLETPARFVPGPDATCQVTVPIRAIRFENVGMELAGRWVLRNLSFEIPGNEFTAIVGQSGCGKTTLFMMLLRLLEPTEGTIRINDTPLSSIPLEQLRSLLGFIPQNPFIFNQSLRENLLVTAPHEDAPDLLAKAVEVAQLDEMIRQRAAEGGLEASAGHMGAKLSGGERQRIALGRLIIQDPQIIVCDEYTANIDVKSAHLIQEAIQQRFRDRTRIVITHQLYSVRNANRILVLDAGRLAQAGSHEELVAQAGLYQDLCRLQMLT